MVIPRRIRVFQNRILGNGLRKLVVALRTHLLHVILGKLVALGRPLLRLRESDVVVRGGRLGFYVLAQMSGIELEMLGGGGHWRRFLRILLRIIVEPLHTGAASHGRQACLLMPSVVSCPSRQRARLVVVSYSSIRGQGSEVIVGAARRQVDGGL